MFLVPQCFKYQIQYFVSAFDILIKILEGLSTSNPKNGDEKGGEREEGGKKFFSGEHMHMRERERVCVCVCVCE